MKDIEIMNIDYTGELASYRRSETHKLSESPVPFLLVDEGPFYTRNIAVKGGGKILTRGVDFSFEDFLTDVEEITGKTVCCTIRLFDKTIQDYDAITVDYQKVGDTAISTRYLMDSIDKILNNDTKVDWNTQIFAKPDTYPPSKHTQDITSKDEVVGFSDLVVLFKQFSGIQKQHGLDLWTKLLTIRDAAYTELNRIYQEKWTTLFNHIKNTSVPHGTTKSDFQLGNHPNYATATLKEDIAGTRSDVLSTPKGFVSALEEFDPDSDGLLRQGSLPFSYYGSGIYLPPPISGSFEGLGTNTGGNALCLESNGWVVALTRGYDSKVKGLYYYYNKNIFSATSDFTYSGYRYESTVMAANGDEPNHIVSGSTGQILLIGDKEKGQYYLALGNGTLDAKSHNLMKVDMSVFNDSVHGAVWNPDKAYIIMIGKYVYIIAQADGWSPVTPEADRRGGSGYRRRLFFRVPVSDLYQAAGTVVTPVKQKMNYQTCEGNWRYNQELVDPCEIVTGNNDAGVSVVKKLVFNLPEAPTTVSLGNPWKCQWFYMENPANKDVGFLKMFHNIRWTLSDTNGSGDYWFCLPFTIDTTTNTLTLDPRWFQISRNIRTNVITTPTGKNYQDWYSDRIAGFCSAHAEIAAAFIPKLGYMSLRTSTTFLPYNIMCSFVGYNPTASGYDNTLTDWEIFNKTLADMDKNGYYGRNVPMLSPFGFSTKMTNLRDVWEYDGGVKSVPMELFFGLNQAGTKTHWGRICKNTFDYTERPEFQTKWVSRKVLAREPSVDYGQVMVGSYSGAISSRIPSVHTSTRDKHSVQYGITCYYPQSYNATGSTGSVNGGLAYSETAGDAVNLSVMSDGSYRLSLLGKHTTDIQNKQIKIEKIDSETVYVTRVNYMSLVKAMLGTNFANVATDLGTNGPLGEWRLSLYMGSKPGSGSDAFPSVAYMIWHEYAAGKDTFLNFMTFNWTQTGTNAAGEKLVNFTNFDYPDAAYGPSTRKVITTGMNLNTNGSWSGRDTAFSAEGLNPTLHMDFTDKDNFDLWFHDGVNHGVPLNSASFSLRLRKAAGVYDIKTPSFVAQYNIGGVGNQCQYVRGFGLCRPTSGDISGGAAFYTQAGTIPTDSYVLMTSVFAGGNWTLFINSDMTAVFNGSEKAIKQASYDLSSLGVPYQNKTFYLYAVSGKAEGYYDLTLSRRTASPYHLLVAVIETSLLGIETIAIEQNFAISGFKISTAREGGIIPASTGTAVETGGFKAVSYNDLFDTSKYN